MNGATARLIGQPARAAMLDALMGGEAFPAGELARAAGVTAQTASGHLARLREGGLVTAIADGRRRRYRLASPAVARAIEALSLLDTPRRPAATLRAVRADEAMRHARTCYNHLAGELGVALHDALIERGAVSATYQLMPEGEELLGRLGVDLARREGRPCLDWTQCRPHLAGPLGTAVCARVLELGWLVRRAQGAGKPGQRALRVTEEGRTGLAAAFGAQLPLQR